MTQRILNQWEIWLIQMGARLFGDPTYGQIIEQIGKATIDEFDGDGQSIHVAADASPITDTKGFPIHYWYFDADGWIVNVLLHCAASPSRLAYLERLRDDQRNIKLLWPQLSEVRCALNPDSPAIFDPITGWTTTPMRELAPENWTDR